MIIEVGDFSVMALPDICNICGNPHLVITSGKATQEGCFWCLHRYVNEPAFRKKSKKD
jgi:hypothetical protein